MFRFTCRLKQVARQVAMLLCCSAAVATAAPQAGTHGQGVVTNSGRSTSPAPQSDTPVVRIEEDWELLIATPAPQKDSPQITNVLSPVSSLSGIYAVFELNYQTMPDYEGGGLSLQLWHGDDCLGYAITPMLYKLATPAERLTYTLALQVSGERLTVELCTLHSTTWPRVRGLKLEIPTELKDLSGYSARFSADNSGVTFGTNRVRRFQLKEVRFLGQDGSVLRRWHPDKSCEGAEERTNNSDRQSDSPADRWASS